MKVVALIWMQSGMEAEQALEVENTIVVFFHAINSQQEKKLLFRSGFGPKN